MTESTPDNHPSVKLLFVTGVFRSGTSLLYACLNSHPAIALMYEAELQSHDLPTHLFTRGRWLENANAWGKFLGRHQLPPYPTDAARHINKPSDAYRLYANENNATYGGEKSPILAEYLLQVARRFPTSKIITISRNPIDIHASILRASASAEWFRQSGTFDRALAAQETLLNSAIQLKKQGRQLLHLTYEDLTKQTETTCRNICDYLELPFDTAMLRPHDADLRAVYSGDHHAKLHSQSIQRTANPDDLLGPEMRDALQAHWQRSLEVISALKRETIPSLPPVHSAIISEAIARGRSVQKKEKIKRRVFHLVPATAVRVFRAAKLLNNNLVANSIEQPSTPGKSLRSVIFFTTATITLLLAASLQILTSGSASPVIPYLLPTLAAGWIFGKKEMIFTSALAAILWSLAPRLTFRPELSDYMVLWNFLSRFSILLFSGILAWQLKASLLQHQKNPHND